MLEKMYAPSQNMFHTASSKTRYEPRRAYVSSEGRTRRQYYRKYSLAQHAIISVSKSPELHVYSTPLSHLEQILE